MVVDRRSTMIRTEHVLAAVLSTSLATAAFATSDHHTPRPMNPGGHDPHGSTCGMHGQMMAGHDGTMTPMHGRMMAGHDDMMKHMHEMMAHMHEAPSADMGDMMHGAAPSMPSLDTLSAEEYEVAFLSMMIAHHAGAVDMAEWILERSEDPDVLAAAEAITAAQDPEIQQMTAWLRDWYDAEVDADWAEMMDADMAGMMRAMEGGEDPDVAFLEEMIRHHQGAIDMAQLALERAPHAEVRDLARDVIVTQAEEVHQYQTWLDQERAE